MKARFQIIEADQVVLDTEMVARNRFYALHELLKSQGVEYDPGQFYQRGDWLCYTGYSGLLYRTSTKFG